MKLFYIILLLIAQGLFGADLTVEKVGKTSLLTMRIDANELFSKKDVIDYRAIFEVFNSEGKVVYLIKKDIALSTEDVKGNKRIIFFLETGLEPAEYTAYLRLNNKLRNDKKEEKFDFSVDENQHFSNLYLVEKVKDINLEVLSWDEVKEDSKIYLYQIYQEEVDNPKFISENKTERKVIDFPSTDNLFQKIESHNLIENFTKNYVEFYLDNKLYQQELKVEKQLNSFQKRYSWDEQLEQIKYIANDKAWKEINRDKKMSKPERVLRFWKSNNPSGSQTNDLQEIFYNRILLADQKFSVHRYKQGWQTDRGRIFIKFGEPDEISVDNHPIGKYPTQTWFYYQLNKTFLFYDRSRIEDYKLYNKEEEYGY
jgi:GWxTD domain-containing protein